jgi:tRNA modification GTPase
MNLTTSLDDTIAAIATPAGVGGIGIVKISGPGAWAIGSRLAPACGSLQEIESHRLYHGHIVDPETGRTVDEVLISFMRAPTTYTRQDVVEINCHSGLAVVHAILELVLRTGARPADPGEFTRRAFLNGRIDLTQAEAVLDLINSRTKRSLDLASEHLTGGLHRIISEARARLLEMQATVEASIDFPEHDLGPVRTDELASHLRKQVCDPIARLLASYEDGRILREGLAVTIAGKPNVGKSSLLNALLDSDRAIVTPIPGTTRDLIEESLSLRGIPLRLVDTAGLGRADNLVERLGMELTRTRLAAADLVLFVLDRSDSLTPEDWQIYEEINRKPRLLLLNKMDLDPHPDFASLRERFPEENPLEISALYGYGIEELKDAVFHLILGHRPATRNSMVAPNLRQKNVLEQTQRAAERALELLNSQGPAELVALEFREALGHLGEITGLTTSEDVLDQIFGKFCVGK